MKTFAQLEAVLAFFEAQRGRLYGFRWKDRFDYRSCASPAMPAPGRPADRDGRRSDRGFAARQDLRRRADALRPADPQAGGRHGRGGRRRRPAAGTRLYASTHDGLVTFAAGHVPAGGAAITAGFQFDVPVRFDTDYLEVDLSHFEAGRSPTFPSSRSGCERDEDLAPALAAHLATGATTMAYCWRVTRHDGVVLGFTEHDRDLVYAGTTFAAAHRLHGLADPAEPRPVGRQPERRRARCRRRRSPRPTCSPAATTTPPSSCSGSTGPIRAMGITIAAGNLGEVKRQGLAFSAEFRSIANRLNQKIGYDLRALLLGQARRRAAARST